VAYDSGAGLAAAAVDLREGRGKTAPTEPRWYDDAAHPARGATGWAAIVQETGLMVRAIIIELSNLSHRHELIQ
jgi:hypothetical protein